MFPVRKILISTTILIPLILTTIYMILFNFGVIKNFDTVSLFSPYIVNATTVNPFIKKEPAGKIINGVWYCLILIAILLGSLNFITSKD
jgi:hypothetical protein